MKSTASRTHTHTHTHTLPYQRRVVTSGLYLHPRTSCFLHTSQRCLVCASPPPPPPSPPSAPSAPLAPSTSQQPPPSWPWPEQHQRRAVKVSRDKASPVLLKPHFSIVSFSLDSITSLCKSDLLSVCVCVCLLVSHHFVHFFVCLYFFLSVYLSVYVCLSFLSVSLWVFVSVYLMYLSVCLSVYVTFLVSVRICICVVRSVTFPSPFCSNTF